MEIKNYKDLEKVFLTENLEKGETSTNGKLTILSFGNYYIHIYYKGYKRKKYEIFIRKIGNNFGSYIQENKKVEALKKIKKIMKKIGL